jgi:hypothetical protein
MRNKNNRPESKTLAELVDYYEMCNRSEGKSPKTVEWYRQSQAISYVFAE